VEIEHRAQRRSYTSKYVFTLEDSFLFNKETGDKMYVLPATMKNREAGRYRTKRLDENLNLASPHPQKWVEMVRETRDPFPAIWPKP
jgi:hypothetical protein